VGVIATAVMGNLQEAVAMAARSGWGTVQFWQETVGVKNVPPQGPNPFPNEVAWFNAARVIPNVQPDGITEFPWFSLILGDLHPHFVALPYELLTVGLAIAVFRNLLARRDHGKLDIGIAALALGLLIPLNTWDVGTFWVIYALAVIAGLLIGGQAARQAAEGRRVGAGGKATAVGQQAAEGDGVGAGGGGTAAGQQTPSTAADAARAGAPRRGVPGAAIPAFLTAIGESLPPVVLEAAAVLVPTFGLAVLLYVPYFLGYQSQPLGLGFVTERTMVGTLFVLFGPLLVLAVGAIVRGWLDALADPGVRAVLGRNWWAIGAAVIVALAPLPRLVPCCGVRDPTLSLLLLLLVGLLPLVVAAWRGPRGAILAPTGTLLLVCTIGLLLGTELIFLRDSFGTRMNTVFKFYYHVWLLLGLLSPVLVAYLLRGRPNPPAPFPAREGGAPAQASAAPPASSQARGTPTPAQPAPPFPDREGGLGGLGRLAFGALAVLIAGGLMVGGMLYPVGATWTKDNAFKDPATLDGAAWMQASRPGDAEAVRWLQEHMPGRPVIAEAFGDDYSEAARVSTFSGLPTLLGWIGHELQWRGNQNLFEQRTQTLETIYRGAEPALLAGLLQTQHVDYVYVGPLEVEKYGAGVRDRFEGQLEPVYHSNDVTIYRVPQPVTVGVGLADLRP
jgi:YYY domain-containing protein